MQIHQIMPSISYGDAVSNHALEIRDIFREWGYESYIYAQNVHPKLKNICRVYTDYNKISSPENILLFHFSIGSDISRFVKNLPDKKILIYHNITPSSFFSGFNDNLANLVRSGREELAEYNGIEDLALGDSEYNRNELVKLGFRNTGVLPIILDINKYNREPNQEILNDFRDEYTNLIFVGRISPNKKQEDIIKVFYYYNKFIDPNSRLFLVGSYEGMEIYYNQLKNLIKRLNLENVYITGHVDFCELLAYYKLADVFISMSEHEGFCVPLLESMHFSIPIIAYNSTAIPYTLKNTGILANKKRYGEIAEMVYLLVNDETLRKKIIQKQRLRLKDFEKPKIEKILQSYINEVIK